MKFLRDLRLEPTQLELETLVWSTVYAAWQPINGDHLRQCAAEGADHAVRLWRRRLLADDHFDFDTKCLSLETRLWAAQYAASLSRLENNAADSADEAVKQWRIRLPVRGSSEP